MIIIPNQPFGIGDIIFTQSLVRHIADGRKIVWPVFPQFVEQLQRAYPDIYFVDYGKNIIDYNRKDQYETTFAGEQATVLPIRWANELMQVPYKDCMRAKYDLYGLDWQMWRDKAMWQPGSIGEVTTEDFTFVNRIFGSDGRLRAAIPKIPNEREMFISPLGQLSLFDWAELFKHATEIHTVSTSIIYLLEMLDLKAPEVHLYSRKRMHNGVMVDADCFSYVNYILQKHRYIFHE